MATERLEKMSDQQLTLLPGIFITSRSLAMPDNCTLELWENCGSKIGTFVDAGPFVLGDWINEGIKRHGISLGAFLKSDVAKAMPGISSFSYDSLNSFACVMEKIPRDYRVKGVSFAHHQTASKLINSHGDEDTRRQSIIEAQGWLQIAKEKSLSLREMAFAINGRTKLGDINKSGEFDKPLGEQQPLAIKYTISDISISLHRQCQPLIAQLEDESDPIEEWTDIRREAAKTALAPLMDDLTKLTDFYICLHK